MTPEVMKRRTRDFGLRAIRLVRTIQNDRIGWINGHQLIRSATSVGANYRAACRARSPAEFRAKLGICEEEADESIHWMEMLVDANFVKQELVADLIAEGNELLSIIIASIKTTKRK